MKIMKHLFCYIVCLWSIFNSAAVSAGTIPDLPNDFSGQVTLEYRKKLQDKQISDLSMADYGAVLWEIGKYFYDKYPDKSFFDKEDFIEQLRPFFPNDSDTELQNKRQLLSNAIATYQAVDDIYNEYIKQKIVPFSYKVVRSATDFDNNDDVPYIEPAAEDEFVKVYNFKKFLTYSENKEERKAIADFKRARKKDANLMDKLGYALQKIEWKKAIFYGETQVNPLLSEEGTSPLLHSKHLDLRLLSRQTYLDGQDELVIGVQILTDSTHFVLANNVASDKQKIRIDLSRSENLKDYEILYPVPFRSHTLPAYHKYFGDFLIPIKVKVDDDNRPLVINADINAVVCGTTELCFNETFAPQMVVKPSGEDVFPNGYDNYFAVTLAQNPQAEPKHLKLEKFVADSDEHGQSLRLEFSTDSKVHHFDVYVEETDGYTTFSAPAVSIADGRIFVRLTPLNEAKYDLIDTQFTVSAVLNNSTFLRQKRFVEAPSSVDIHALNLNWGLIFLAILGGFLLNFMPCVFPVLSLKIMGISYNIGNTKNLKSSLWQTVCGIFVGFTLIICFLIIVKYLGYSLGWGMQYQNISFLVVMVFVLCAIMISARRWNVYGHISAVSKHKISDFLIGTLIVLLATPCTGPYLATAIGFALTGTNNDMTILLYAVAIGLSLPYLIIICFDEPQNFFPKPGKWMNKLNIVMQILMFLSIGWFFVLIYYQTDFKCVSKLAFLAVLFCGIFKLFLNFMDFLDERSIQQIPTETEANIRQNGKYIMLFLSLIFITVGILTVNSGRESNKTRYEAGRQTFVDLQLIKEKIAQGRAVLLEIGADWCLTCHYNDITVLTEENLAYWQDAYNMDFMHVDWTDYRKETLDYMARFGRKGLPFYILYTPIIREGIVLPEIFDADDLRKMLTKAD